MTSIQHDSVEIGKPAPPVHAPPAPEIYGDMTQLEKKMDNQSASHIWKLDIILLGFDICVPLIAIAVGFLFIIW